MHIQRSFLLVLLFILFMCGAACAQISPAEGSELNYRLIGFSFPGKSIEDTKACRVEIAKGNFTDNASFQKNIVATFYDTRSRIIGLVPSFGQSYTWRYVTSGINTNEDKSDLYHFRTAASEQVDTSLVRLRIQQHAGKFKDAYVFLDANATLYDMKGNPVWFLPGKRSATNTRDVKASSFGTITYLCDEGAHEAKYDGTHVWEGPDDGRVGNGKKEMYHHEFNRLSNGHYMVMGNEFLYTKAGMEFSDKFFSSLKRKTDLMAADTDFVAVMCATIIEYDDNGKVVWNWKASDYFKTSDLNDYGPTEPEDQIKVLDVHANSFFFDEKEKMLYVGFKNISRVVKIKYPEGKIVNEYGEKYRTGVAPGGNGLFCHQHACKRSSIGCLFLFNNNGCEPGGFPKIKKLTEPNNENATLKKIWEYTCNTDNNQTPPFVSGGNVEELPDGAIFVCMGSQYSKVFIVAPDKRILWSALPEKWNCDAKTWKPAPQYRASIINDKKLLEQLVFNTK